MTTNLKDITFIIPIRLDSIARLENLLLTIDYLTEQFETHILVLEAAPYCNGLISNILKGKIVYKFVEDRDDIFYRTKYLNEMTDEVQTPYLAIWDADVIIENIQIEEAVQKLRAGEADIVFPYDGHFYDVTTYLRIHYLCNRDIAIFKRNETKMNLPYGMDMIGGAIIVNREKYVYAGKENLQFYGWGPEDAERYYRWEVFKYKIYRCKGSLYHLTHPRDVNGKPISNEYFDYLNAIATTIPDNIPEELIRNFNQ
jgi:hypothetical protein